MPYIAQAVPISSAPSLAARRGPTVATERERLLEAAATGDAEAWTAIVERFAGCIRAVTRAHRLSAQDAEDVLQATWLSLFENVAAIRQPDRLGAWLQTTARRLSLRLLRQAHRQQPTQSDFFDRQATYDDADGWLAQGERRVALDSAVKTLPVRHRRLIRMLLAEADRSYAELSAELEMPIGSIGPIRARALARLRRYPALLSAA